MQILIPIRKAEGTLTLDTLELFGGDVEKAQTFDMLYAASRGFAYLFDYGLRQTCNDGHASNTVKGGAKAVTIMEHAKAKLAKAIAGLIVRGGGGRSPIADPVLRRAMKVVTERWAKLSEAAQNAMIGQAKLAIEDSDEMADDDVVDHILDVWAAQPDIMDAARQFVALENAKKTAETVTVDELKALFVKSVSEITPAEVVEKKRAKK